MTRNHEPESLYKILMVGNSSVGKTSIVHRYCDNVFSATYVPTTGIDFKLQSTSYLKMKLKLEIWDVEGKFLSSSDLENVKKYIRAAMGVMFIYDISNMQSFLDIKKWINTMDDNSDSDLPKILLGNKCDLRSEREVAKAQGEALALENQMRFFETSAKLHVDTNIKNAFCIMIYDMRLQNDHEFAQSFELQEEKKEVKSYFSECFYKILNTCFPCFMKVKDEG